jgi:hypothetical protein
MGLFGKKKPGAGSDPSLRTEMVWSRDMRLRVAAPSGGGWRLMEAGQQGGGLLAGMKCMRGSPPDALALDARLYAVVEGQGGTAEQLAQRDWKALYLRTMFAEIDSISAQVADHPSGDPGCELNIVGRCREPDQPMRLREWHVPTGDKLLVLSAAGAPEQHQVSGQQVEFWLSNALLGA